MAPHGCLFPYVEHNEILRGAPFGSGRLYPALPREWSDLKAPQYLCVPNPTAVAYVAAPWMPVDPFGREAVPETRRLIDAILLSEWAVLGLLCFLDAARDGLPFFTRCPDPCLASRNGNEPGKQGSLFRLSPGLLQLIRTVEVAAILDDARCSICVLLSFRLAARRTRGYYQVKSHLALLRGRRDARTPPFLSILPRSSPDCTREGKLLAHKGTSTRQKQHDGERCLRKLTG